MWKPQRLYSEYILNQPVLFTGEGALNGLAAVPCATITVVHGSSLKSETKDKLKTIFRKKTVYFVERSWKGEPDLDSLSEVIGKLEEQAPDMIIAIGGGSVIDGAKLCRLYYEYPSFDMGVSRIGQLSFSTRFIAVPTTIGSGAEVSSAAVYINATDHRKEMVVCHDFLPEAVVLEPSMVSEAPIETIVSSGVDAMAHIIEGYVSTMNNGIADVMAETGLKILAEELGKGNLSHMDFSRLQYAGYLGGVVQNHCIVGAAHGIAHQLTVDGFSHGDAVALLLPAVIKANRMDSGVAVRYERFFYNASIPSVDMFLSGLVKIIDAAGIGKRRKELKEILSQKLKDESFINNVKEDQGAKGNPVEINKDYLEIVLGEI